MFGKDERLERLDKLIEMQFELNRAVMHELLNINKVLSEIVKDIYKWNVHLVKKQKGKV